MSAGAVPFPYVGRVVVRRERGDSLIDWQGVIVEQLGPGYVRVSWGRTSLPDDPAAFTPSNVEALDELAPLGSRP